VTLVSAKRVVRRGSAGNVGVAWFLDRPHGDEIDPL
jgi:hypothetical protein